jgi:hypothetical protein
MIYIYIYSVVYVSLSDWITFEGLLLTWASHVHPVLLPKKGKGNGIRGLFTLWDPTTRRRAWPWLGC